MRRATAAVLLAVSVVLAACGSNLSRDELLAGAGTGNIAEATGPGSGSSNASDVGEVGQDPSAEVDAGTAAGQATGEATSGTTGTPASGGTGGSTAAAGGTKVANKSQIVIASVATISGPVGNFFGHSVDAVTVWANWINRHGGVNGHPVKHLVINDGGDPGRFNAGVRQAKEAGAIAFVFNTMGFGGHGDMSFFEENGIPLIGDEGGLNLAYTSPMLFTPYVSGSPYAYMNLRGFADVVVPEGKTKVAAITCSDVSICDLFASQWDSETAASMGLDLVYTARPSLVQPDYTAECLGAQNAGAQAIIIGLDPASIQRVAKACARQGYNPTYSMPDILALPFLAQDPVLDGIIIPTRTTPWAANETQAIAELTAAFKEVAPGVPPDGAHATGWAAARLFEAAARNLPDNPTAADVLAGLYALQNENLNGFSTYPISFSKGTPPKPQVCYGIVRSRGGKFVAQKGGDTRCDPKTNFGF